ncbi:MAG: cytosine deaminase [Rhodobacteraceae bacterium]|nr:cytosine deaminase [Paracoccaceae bacterium]
MAMVLPETLGARFVLTNASVPGCLLPAGFQTGDTADLQKVDLEISDGTIVKIFPSGSTAFGDVPCVDLDDGMVLPTLVDVHTHLDKGHIWSRKPNPDGTFAGALKAVGEDRVANWTPEDVRARMEFGLKCAYVYGTSALRTHIDSLPPQDEVSWPILCELREDWKDRIELQGSCLFGIDRLEIEPEYLKRIADRVDESGGLLGSVTYMVPNLEKHLDAIFQAAMDRGLDLDFHVDETKDVDAKTLRAIAEAAIRAGFEGKILCGHCCSIARQDSDYVDGTLDLVARAGISVVSLPMCNMYLQDREPGRTPRWRGVTLLHEMRARGIPVAVASDNTRDPFYAYGDLDLLEVYSQATRILQLDHPIGDWISTVSTSPAQVMGSASGQISQGGNADLIVLKARNWSELLSRPRGARDVLRKGIVVTEELPDYRELDGLFKNGSSQS